MTTTRSVKSKLNHTDDNDGNATIDSVEYRRGRISSRKKPNTTVLPRSSGPIKNPERNDILSGRGGKSRRRIIIQQTGENCNRTNISFIFYVNSN